MTFWLDGERIRPGKGLYEFEAAPGELTSAMIEQGFLESGSIGGLSSLDELATGGPTFKQYMESVQAGIAPPGMLSPEDATAKYGIPSELTFDTYIMDRSAEKLHRLTRERLARQNIVQRSVPGFGTSAAILYGQFIGSALDPLNVASAFIPVVGPTRYAIWANRFGKTAARTFRGVTEGAVGAAIVEPLVLAGAAVEQRDYGVADSMLNIAFGGALGGGLHVGAGFIGDRLAGRRSGALPELVEAAPPEVKEAALRGAVAAVVEGRPVEVAPLFDSVIDAVRQGDMRTGADVIGAVKAGDRAAGEAVIAAVIHGDERTAAEAIAVVTRGDKKLEAGVIDIVRQADNELKDAVLAMVRVTDEFQLPADLPRRLLDLVASRDRRTALAVIEAVKRGDSKIGKELIEAVIRGDRAAGEAVIGAVRAGDKATGEAVIEAVKRGDKQTAADVLETVARADARPADDIAIVRQALREVDAARAVASPAERARLDTELETPLRAMLAMLEQTAPVTAPARAPDIRATDPNIMAPDERATAANVSAAASPTYRLKAEDALAADKTAMEAQMQDLEAMTREEAPAPEADELTAAAEARARAFEQAGACLMRAA
jgi:hypothetical protein